MTDPRGYPGQYGPGYPPQQGVGSQTPPGGQGWPQQHHHHPQQQQQLQHQHQHQHGYGPGPGPGPGFYPPQPHPNFQGGMPMPQPQFNSNPLSFHSNNPNIAGFNSPRPGPGGGPPFGHGGGGGGGGLGRPPFSPAQSYGPGTSPQQHMPSPMMMPQPPQPPRHQDWPISGRPPTTPIYPANNNASYPSASGQPSAPYVPKPYAPPVQNPPPSSVPAFNTPNPPRPSYSPNMNATPSPISSPPSSAPRIQDTPKPATNSATAALNTHSNPLSAPSASTYRPKTSYQATASASPKKPLSVPSPSPSLQSISSSTSTSNHTGYHSSHSQHRPPIHGSESFDADDRPTELIPWEDDASVASSPHIHVTSSQKIGSQSAQSPPTAPSFSSATPYLPTSPNQTDLDKRQGNQGSQHTTESVKIPDSYKRQDTIIAATPASNTPLTPLPTPSIKFPPSTNFVPSTSYVPTKKDAKSPSISHSSSSNSGFDSTVKVEVSTMKSTTTSTYDQSSIKVALNDMPSRPINNQNDVLDSPISLDGLLESVKAMGRHGESPSLSNIYQGPSPLQQDGNNMDRYKPLPVINENNTEQRRYSLTDGPATPSTPVQLPNPTQPLNPSQSPPINRLVPKRPNSSASQGDLSQPANNFDNLSPPQTHQQPSFFPPTNALRFEESPKTSFQPQHPPVHNHGNIGGNAMQIFTQPGFSKNPIASMAALNDRPVQKAPSMVRRGKTLRRAAGVTGSSNLEEPTQALPILPTKITADDLFPYLLRLVLLAQEEDAPAPAPALAQLPTGKDTQKDVVKALRSKVKDILSDKDLSPEYQDPVVKKTLRLMEPKQFKSFTNVEELIVGFSIEMSRTQQSMGIPSNNRDAQIAIMVNLIRSAIRQDPFTGHESVLKRLDALVKVTSTKPSNSTVQADELTKAIKEIFKQQESTRLKLMNDLRRGSSRKIAVEDLKKCVSNLSLDSFPYPGIADYHNKEHHDEFKNRELSALNGLIKALSASNPNMASIDVPSRQFHPSEFTFIPPNPKAYYHSLLEICVEHSIASRGENEPSSNLLSTTIKSLLKDCGVRWRLTSSWREIILMEIIKEKYREGRISIHFLLDFLQSKFYKDIEVNQWHISEVNMLRNVYGGLNHMIFDNINHDMRKLQDVSAEYFAPMLDVLHRVHQQEVYQRLNIDLTPFFEDINETVLTESIQNYKVKDQEIQKEKYENETVPLREMAIFIVSEHAVVKKRFPKPLFGTIDVAAIVVEHYLRNFVPMMQNMANMDAKKLPMSDVFPLYHACVELVTLFETYAPSSSVHFNLSDWFKPYVLKYLDILDASIAEWVTRAIMQDKFEEVSVGAGHSSSASDLFSFFYEPLGWVKGLNWPNEYQRATFVSRLAKVFCKAVDLYAQYMETMFNDFMPASVSATASNEVKSLSDQLASFTFRSESADAKKATQFVFTPKMCVLMNNIEAVRQRLDELYRNMDVDEAAEILHEQGPVVEQDPNAPRQFEIVFVCAERLLPLDSNEASDPFIVMWQDGKEVFRSKTISANINPRWNESFEVTLTKDITYLIRIYDADKVHKDRLCGWQYLSIDPQDYEDYMAHDVWLDLTQIGRLLLRITLKGERDDIQFFFGRTFRSLKRKEAEMSAMIVDAMLPTVRACLSEKVLFSNFRSKSLFPFFGTSVSSVKVTEIKDEDCDNALNQLYDYLELSLPILYDYLTSEGMTMVITKLWKEILLEIESLLVPPLSNTISDRTPLTEIETHVVFKIVEFIKLFLNGGDEGDGFPLKVLEIPKYKDLLTVRPIYDSSAQDLMAEYKHALTVPGRGRMAPPQSGFDRRQGANARRPGADSLTPNPETILRILRMRHEESVEEYLGSEIEKLSKAREARAQAKRDQLNYQRQVQNQNHN